MASRTKAVTKKRISRTWPANLSARLTKLRQKMADEGLDGLLISHPPDIQYLTGFSGEDSWALVTGRNVIILSDSRFEEELSVRHKYARAIMRKGAIAEALGPVVEKAKLQRMGIQADHLSVAARRAIAKQTGAKTLKEISGWMLHQRAVKDADEVRLIERAVAIQEQAFAQLLDELKPGMTEQQIAALLEYQMRSLGADGPSFNTIIAVGPNGSIPHYRPGPVKLQGNMSLLIDFGARYQGYCSDMTRVISLGRMSPKLAEIYDVVREAMLAAIDAIEPGKALKDVDEVARRIIKKAGYAKQFGHGLGHGIGLEIHEAPRLSNKAEGVLEVGHVVTVEPGIYLPGVGGVRLEDDVLVTERGRRNLCSLPTDRKSAMI